MDKTPKKNPGQRTPIQAYQKTSVLTASRESILLMLYAGAIRFLKQAIEAADRNDLAEKGRLLSRAQDIICELRATLNFEAGGEIAKNLDMLYDFIMQRLIQAAMEKKVDVLKEALSVLETLYAGWEEAIASIRKDKA